MHLIVIRSITQSHGSATVRVVRTTIKVNGTSQNLPHPATPSVDGVALVDHVIIYLLRLLRNQGLSPDQLNTVFVGLIVSRLLYALPAWGVLVSAAQVGRIDVFLKRAHKWGFCKDVVTRYSKQAVN